MFSYEQKIVIFFLALEFITITVLVLLAYAFKLYFVWEKKSNHKKREEILKHFLEGDSNTPPPYLDQPDLLLKVLGKTSEVSDDYKSRIVSEYLLDKTRSNVDSKNSLKRYYLTKAYQYAVSPYDKENLIKLINDKYPIISLSAVSVCYALSSKEVYQAVIEKLRSLSLSTQKIYISNLSHDETLLTVLKSYLTRQPDDELKQLCYIILDAIEPDSSFFELAEEDIHDKNIECRLRAIPVLIKSSPEKAFSMLKELLNDSSWLIRNKIIHTLAMLKRPDCIPFLADALNDENRWVRVNAAKGLAQLGDEGRLLLTEYKGMTEAVEPSLAAYFLDIQRMKEHA